VQPAVGARLLALAALVSCVAGAAAAAVDPSGDGPHAVGVATLVLEDSSRDRSLTVELWYPAEASGRDAPIARRRHRLVLLLHGHCGSRTNYVYLASALASFGFVVAAPDLPGVARPGCEGGTEPPEPAEDVAFVVRVLRDRAGPAALFAQAVRSGRYGLLAHSLGALVSLETCLADRDARVAALLAPFATIDGAVLGALRPRLALLVAGATGDTRVPFETSALFFEGLAAPAFLVKIVGGSHSGFGEDDEASSPEAVARQHHLARRYVAAFLLRYLAGDRRLRRVLAPEDAAAQGDDVELVARPRR
jgi:dienelactone hydrolase